MQIRRAQVKGRTGSIKNILLVVMVLICVAVVGGWILTDGFSDPTAEVADAGVGEAKAIEKVERQQSDVLFSLNGQNTDIKWTGSNSVGQKPTGFFYELSGEAVVGQDDRSKASLKSLTFDIDIDGMQAMASSLTKKLKHKGFFEVDKYPQATFVSTSIEKVSPEENEGSGGVTHLVEGNFQLKDVTQSIRIPVHVEASQDALKLSSTFKINRRDYGVIYSDALGDKLIRDSVLIELTIDSTAKEGAAVVAGEAKATEEPLGNFTETIKATLVEFDMVLVPGDVETSVAPFWIGKTEVTWDEFDYWALCKNMKDKDSIREISQLLRPSSPHDLEKLYRGWGREKQPVVGVSKLSAELYCKWLSKQTGKNFRLPTDEEWDRAFELGGGDLDSQLERKALAEVAWFSDNALSTDDEGFDFERAMPVATREPNKLGIHDMLGNASEWVIGSDQQPVVRGGHFKLAADELVGAHREAEDQSIWNEDYPQEPKSMWWYVNADYVGFRVVCEPAGKAEP